MHPGALGRWRCFLPTPVRGWPTVARRQLVAVAMGQDLHPRSVIRHNETPPAPRGKSADLQAAETGGALVADLVRALAKQAAREAWAQHDAGPTSGS